MKHILAIITVLTLLLVSAKAQELKEQNLFAPAVGSLLISDNSSTNLASGTYRDANLWANTDGTIPNVAVLVSVLGTNAAATNTFTLTLRPVYNVSTTTAANNVMDNYRTFVVTLSATNTTRSTTCTNIPSTALPYGTKALRLVSVATSDDAGNGVNMAVTAKIVGFAP